MPNKNHINTTDLNELNIPLVNKLYIWRANKECKNAPLGAFGILEAMKIDSDNFQIQRYTTLESVPRIFIRCKIDGIWHGWSEA